MPIKVGQFTALIIIKEQFSLAIKEIPSTKTLETQVKGFVHHEIDVRDRPGILDLIDSLISYAIVHTVAKPSHDVAVAIPFDDFDINQCCREAGLL